MRIPRPFRSPALPVFGVLGFCLLTITGPFCHAQLTNDSSQTALARGVQLLRDGQPEQAKQLLTLAIKAAPRSADALTWRGICENQLQQYPAAAADLEAALRLDGTMLPAHYNFALTLIRLHRTTEAIAQFRIVLAAQPDAMLALYNLGVLLESQGSFAEAAETLRRARTVAPSDPGIALHLLLDDLKLHNTSELTPLITQLADPAVPADMEREAGTALLESARFADAITLLTAARNREAGAPGIDLLLARALIADHQDAAAIALLNTASPVPQQAPDRAYLLGLAYLDQGATAEAAGQFEAARTLDPHDARPIYHLALLAAAAPAGRNQAADLLRSAVALEPANLDYALALARLLLVEDKADETRAVLMQVANPAPSPGGEQAQYHALLGVALAALHQLSPAIQQLQRALVEDPSLALAHNVLGFCFLQQGDYAQAAAAYGRASQLDPGRALYARDAALAYERADRAEEATRFAERAVQLDSANAGDHVLLGKLYAAVGRRLDALQQLLRAATLDPDSDAACYLLARTYQQQGEHQQAVAWSDRLAALKQQHAADFSLQKQAAAQAIRSSRLLEGGSYSDPAVDSATDPGIGPAAQSH